MICMYIARGPWFDGLWLLAVKWFEFLGMPQACAQGVPMAEKKCLIAATALMKRAGPILGVSGVDAPVLKNLKEFSTN